MKEQDKNLSQMTIVSEHILTLRDLQTAVVCSCSVLELRLVFISVKNKHDPSELLKLILLPK